MQMRDVARPLQSSEEKVTFKPVTASPPAEDPSNLPTLPWSPWFQESQDVPETVLDDPDPLSADSLGEAELSLSTTPAVEVGDAQASGEAPEPSTHVAGKGVGLVDGPDPNEAKPEPARALAVDDDPSARPEIPKASEPAPSEHAEGKVPETGDEDIDLFEHECEEPVTRKEQFEKRDEMLKAEEPTTKKEKAKAKAKAVAKKNAKAQAKAKALEKKAAAQQAKKAAKAQAKAKAKAKALAQKEAQKSKKAKAKASAKAKAQAKAKAKSAKSKASAKAKGKSRKMAHGPAEAETEEMEVATAAAPAPSERLPEQVHAEPVVNQHPTKKPKKSEAAGGDGPNDPNGDAGGAGDGGGDRGATEKASFARRYRPSLPTPARRWDTMKAVFNTRAAARCHRPSSLEAIMFFSNFPAPSCFHDEGGGVLSAS